MSTHVYPRVETIEVPEDIKPEHIGKYATNAAHELLMQIGIGGIVPRSARLSRSGRHSFTLSFDTTTQYGLPKDLDIRLSDGRELPVVEEVRVAGGNQGGPGTAKQARAAK